ncbi:serine/threonine-protein kinase [Prosthecobacter sp.]|uniref:serine/threonine-protein kinase n=1 Tax=Prosthecobacter sp. TaxID=1965333 RepID=UPI002ABAA739|nr:serine/threonine-protein kinase [Prosthecobacter sp.]MDZ4402818.1 serine/threonine-protein kinase [Prosthecobacter sp.]
MNSESTPCPKCGCELPSDAPQGLCPRCLAALNFATETMPPDAAPVATQTPLTPEELAPHFPQLEILECLGRGGMGVVYKARQKSLNRLVALKLLAPERADDAKFAARFEKEAQALAALNHPHIVTIHDFGQAGGFYFLLMEFIDGVNLRQAMTAGRFTPEQALAIVPPVCEALQYAHEHGIVHRDIKPENLLMDKEGRVKIADFGIAKIVARESSRGSGDEEPREDSRTTALGTPTYAAPEQQSDPRHADHRVDIYSLGVVLYELLTGELPQTNLEPPSKRVQIDVRLDEIVLRALETKPEMRFATAAEFRTQVEAAIGTSGNSRREEAHVGTPSRFLKIGTSTLVTPEKIATASGQFSCHRTRGQLILDDHQLTHSRAGTTTVIPLTAIRDLSIGRYPRTMNPVGLDLLSVTYEEDAQCKQVLLSPMEGIFDFPSIWNARVAEWFTAIRDAVTAATGRAPGNTPAERLGVPSGSKLIYALYLLPVVIGITIVLVLAMPLIGGSTSGGGGDVLVFALGLLLLIFALPFIIGRLFRRRSSPVEPQGALRRPWRWAGVAGLSLGTALLLGAPVLNEIVDDFGLTVTARKHLVARQRAGQQAIEARRMAADKQAELNTVRTKQQAATEPEQQERIRLEAATLTKDSQRLQLRAMQADLALNHAALAKERTEQQRIALFYLIAGALLMAGVVALFHRARDGDGSAQPRRRGAAIVILGLLAVGGAAVMLAVWSYRLVGHFGGGQIMVKSAAAQLVGVEGNVVTVDLHVQVEGGIAEVRTELTGHYPPADKRRKLVDADRNTGQSSLVMPGAPAGNQPWRAFPPGLHAWRLNFVLPTPELAQQASKNLRPIGELPVIAGKTYAGTIFDLEDTGSTEQRASLKVSEVMTSAHPRWVSLYGQRSWNESHTEAVWFVSASQPGMVHLGDDEGNQRTSLQRDAKTKLHAVKARIELSKVGADRVRIVRAIGGATATSEITGDYLLLRDELLDTALNSAKTEQGARVELCRLNGRPLLLEVPVIQQTPHEQTQPAAVRNEHVTLFPFIALAVVAIIVGGLILLILSARKKGNTGCMVVLLILLVGGLLFVTAAAVYMLSYRAVAPRSAASMSSQVELSSNGSHREYPGGLVHQASNFLNVRVPEDQLAVLEVFMRQGDDSRVLVPELSAIIGAGKNAAYNGEVFWTAKRDDDNAAADQLWFWAVNASKPDGTRTVPNRDVEAHFSHHIEHDELLNWWPLETPAQTFLPPGSMREITLFRTHGSATIHPEHPKEMILRVRTMKLPPGITILPGQALSQAGTAADTLIQALPQPAASTAPQIPMAIDFNMLRVENPPGSRDICVFFERDSNHGLGIELWQDVTRAPDGKVPAADDPFWLRKHWIGLHDTRVLNWTLPDDFTPAEVSVATRQIEQELMQRPRLSLPDGAVPEIGHIKHRDGWTYTMALRILREPGVPRPPAPEGALFTCEKDIVLPDHAVMRVQLQKSAKDGRRIADGEPLTFQTANTAKGFVLRWHAYKPTLPNGGPNYLLDFVDPNTGAIFHRIEGGFPPGTDLSSPDVVPLPDTRKNIQFTDPGITTHLRLLRASMRAAPGAVVSAWWDVYLEVAYLSPKDKPVPQFQLPEL